MGDNLPLLNSHKRVTTTHHMYFTGIYVATLTFHKKSDMKPHNNFGFNFNEFNFYALYAVKKNNNNQSNIITFKTVVPV